MCLLLLWNEVVLFVAFPVRAVLLYFIVTNANVNLCPVSSPLQHEPKKMSCGL